MNSRETWRIRDSVHGLIVFGGGNDEEQNETDRIAWRLLDTPEFQRLRRIRQLGFSDLVYPGATHSRFAHAVGVYHTARRLIEVIGRRHKELPDRARERVALLAALLHDIGHGPFSHVFEHAAHEVGLTKRHEDWGTEIIQGDTQVNSVLREVDAQLPDQVGALLKEETPKDIYATVVSSQFDADRLDYLQRDRLMTGVQFGHLDRDWLLDCLEVGSVTLDEDEPVEAPCLYLNAKGISVAEEYLEARFRLYTMVYMHKTTRAAEKMLGRLLTTATQDLKDGPAARRDPVLRYFTSGSPQLGVYLDLDDTAVWATLATLAASSDSRVAELARRLRDRRLYKCLDVGILDEPGGNLYGRFRKQLRERYAERYGELLFDDDDKVTLYKRYSFEDSSALNKVLVKTRNIDSEPRDIANVSDVIQALREAEFIKRVYAPNHEQIQELSQILQEVRT